MQSTLISPPFDITAKNLGYNVLGDTADFGLPYQHETVATTERFLREHPDSARKFLRAFIAGIHPCMTDEKATKQVLAKRLKITDKGYSRRDLRGLQEADREKTLSDAQRD